MRGNMGHIKKRGKRHPVLSPCAVCHRRQLHFDTVSFSIPSPKPTSSTGEDAFFADAHAITVFDGVSASTTQTTNAALYSAQLAHNTKRHLDYASNPTLKAAVKHALNDTTVGGSSTVCGVTLTGDQLLSFNVGDSGFIVIRNGVIVHKSEFQRHSSSTPYQVSFTRRDDFAKSVKSTFRVCENDIVIVATDGFWDNMFSQRILDLWRCTNSSQHRASSRPSSRNSTSSSNSARSQREGHKHRTHTLQVTQRLEQPNVHRSSSQSRLSSFGMCLADEVCEVSHSFTMRSPFSELSNRNGCPCAGGKKDDITFCIGRITSKAVTSHCQVNATCPIRSPFGVRHLLDRLC